MPRKPAEKQNKNYSRKNIKRNAHLYRIKNPFYGYTNNYIIPDTILASLSVYQAFSLAQFQQIKFEGSSRNVNVILQEMKKAINQQEKQILLIAGKNQQKMDMYDNNPYNSEIQIKQEKNQFLNTPERGVDLFNNQDIPRIIQKQFSNHDQLQYFLETRFFT